MRERLYTVSVSSIHSVPVPNICSYKTTILMVEVPERQQLYLHMHVRHLGRFRQYELLGEHMNALIFLLFSLSTVFQCHMSAATGHRCWGMKSPEWENT